MHVPGPIRSMSLSLFMSPMIGPVIYELRTLPRTQSHATQLVRVVFDPFAVS